MIVDVWKEGERSSYLMLGIRYNSASMNHHLELGFLREADSRTIGTIRCRDGREGGLFPGRAGVNLVTRFVCQYGGPDAAAPVRTAGFLWWLRDRGGATYSWGAEPDITKTWHPGGPGPRLPDLAVEIVRVPSGRPGEDQRRLRFRVRNAGAEGAPATKARLTVRTEPHPDTHRRDVFEHVVWVDGLPPGGSEEFGADLYPAMYTPGAQVWVAVDYDGWVLEPDEAEGGPRPGNNFAATRIP